jgi:putative membrane-bound dehydrogenase-like protein
MQSPRLVSAWLGASLALLPHAQAADPAPPTVRDARMSLRLFAAAPDVVTPIGIAVDARQRVYVLESHTHFPKADYPGPKADRIQRLEDTDGDGRADRITVFHEGLHHGMNLAFSPAGQLHATHRNGLVRLEDRDGDGLAERRVDLLVMDTPGNYPHNGIGGLAFSPDGWIYVGLGENLGERFTLRGTDGRAESDREGGLVFRCRPDGSHLERVASGFWNPFGLAFHGREFLLAVDNDPDSRPPNRLLDVIPGGDYGFKFRFGRQGLHPFQAWNGELPGTLPMAGAVGEGSSAVLPCDKSAVRTPSARPSRPSARCWRKGARTSVPSAWPRRRMAPCSSPTGWTPATTCTAAVGSGAWAPPRDNPDRGKPSSPSPMRNGNNSAACWKPTTARMAHACWRPCRTGTRSWFPPRSAPWRGRKDRNSPGRR